MVERETPPAVSGAANEFFRTMRASFDSAVAIAGAAGKSFRIGNDVVRLRFAGSALDAMLSPSLAHLEVPPGGRPALTVNLFDSASSGVPCPRAGWDPSAFGQRGEISGFNTERFRTVFQQGSDILLMLDRERSEAVYWTADCQRIPYWERSFPLRTLFHWWFEDRNLQPAHAAAVGLAEGGVLIAGQSGSGKSTSALACLDSELLYAGDDYVLIGHSPPHVYSLYSTAKLDPDNLSRLPHLGKLVANADRLDREKAMIFLQRSAPEKLSTGFPIRAILIPRITGLRETTMRRATAGETFLALAPTTLCHLPGAERQGFEKLKTLVRQTPAYWLEAGTELPGIPAAILRLLKDPERI